MKRVSAVLFAVVMQLAGATSSLAHPGSGIVVDSQGNVFVSDINRGLLRFNPDGKVSVVLKESGGFSEIRSLAALV